MKIRVGLILYLFLACHSVFAGRELSSGEVNAILATLTQTPVQTWLPTGSIQARHLQYHETEKTVSESNEMMYFDGLRFYWEIILDAVGEEKVSENSHSEPGLMDANKCRTFCWDGTNYTRYYQSAGNAIVESSGTQTPLGTYGPFSAGVIPWGNSIYTMQHLSQCICTASELEVGGQRQINLQIIDKTSDRQLQMNFVLDADRNYAVISFLVQDPQISGIEQRYSQYVQVGDHWVPTMITIERFLKTQQGRRVVSYEDWLFESVTSELPAAMDFSVQFKNGTLVELQSPPNAKSVMYYANDRCDISSLLEEKLNLAAQSNSTLKNNCATVAAQFVAGRFSRSFSVTQLESLISSQNGMTSLSALKAKLEEAGLYCAAITTTIDDIQEMENAVVILHLPASNHYVILDHIDQKDVWTIDLTSRKIYWKTSIQQFLQEWKSGTALVVSNVFQDMLTDTEGAIPLPLETQQQIQGGETVKYSCSELIQSDDVIYCSEPVGIVCLGCYYRYFERYGCIEDPNTSEPSCKGDQMPGHYYAICSTNEDFTACIIPGDLYYRYIRACK